MEFTKLEGSGINQLSQVIRRLGYNEYDRFELATITSISPTLVKLDGTNLVLDANDLIITEHLTERKQLVTLEDGTQTEVTFHSPLKPGDRVIVVSTSNGQFYVVIDKAVMI